MIRKTDRGAKRRQTSLAFAAIASLLAMLALVTLIVKTFLERRLDEAEVSHDH